PLLFGIAATWCGFALPGTAFLLAALFPLFLLIAQELLWRVEERSRKKGFLWLSIGMNLLVLVFFKYFNFFAENFEKVWRGIAGGEGWQLPAIVLPVAISFYTFQSIAYAVDIYRGKATPLKEFSTFAAYLAFFPQLVAGPIERPGRFLPQFEVKREWNPELFRSAAALLLSGYFKKVFVADNCALLVNYAFDPATPLNAAWAGLGVVAFAFQIYGDFSGYTDIARGSARLMGIELSRNFIFPYLARSPSDFWQRWHITLSTWFRDYVYIPLGGNRSGAWMTARNLAITMLLAGLWHGANWTFLAWGAFHAVILVLFHFSKRWQQLATAPGWFARFSSVTLMFVLTCVGWAIFRSENMQQLVRWMAAFTNWNEASAALKPFYWFLLHTIPLLLLQWAAFKSGDEAEPALPWGMRGAVYAVMTLCIASSISTEQEFIYFQF
ncbi:MAG: MBOAT family O-acyltransferase, partial [Verrucomicrobiota bacterium]|nr:MBOAT family O-acyltransferase [Verrucomicrobiota bacterium]